MNNVRKIHRRGQIFFNSSIVKLFGSHSAQNDKKHERLHEKAPIYLIKLISFYLRFYTKKKWVSI